MVLLLIFIRLFNGIIRRKTNGIWNLSQGTNPAESTDEWNDFSNISGENKLLHSRTIVKARQKTQIWGMEKW